MSNKSLVLAGCALLAAGVIQAQVATVDGVGGVPTADPTFTTSYDTVANALTAVKASGLNIAGQTCEISITAGNAVAEGVAASLDLDTLCNLTIDGDVAGSAYGGELAVLRLTASDATGSPAGTEGIAIECRDGQTVTLRDLVLIPNNAAPAGAYNHRMFQIFNSTTTHTSILNFDRVIITARKVSDNSPVLNPFAHAASANTRAARNAELCAFDGGGGNNAIVVQNGAAGAPTAGLLTINMNDTYVTHLGMMPAAASRGGGIAMARTNFWTLNINGGSVFSYLDGCGIRGVNTMAATSSLNVNGTLAKPVFFLYNGWMEDAASTARNEHIQNDGSPVTINYGYFIGSYQEAVELTGNGADSISNSYFANAQATLDTTTAAPSVVTAALVRTLNSAAAASTTFTNCTFFDNLGVGANDSSIHINTPSAGWTMTTTNCVFAGADDQITHAGTNAVTWNEDDCGFATAGAHALAATYVVNGTGLTRNSTDRVEADPAFASTTFAPSFSTVFTTPGNLTDYLRLTSLAYGSASARINPVSAVDVVGANAASTVPVELDSFMID